MKKTIRQVDFIGWFKDGDRAQKSFVCVVTYDTGRRYHYYGRIPAPVARRLREIGHVVNVSPDFASVVFNAIWAACYE